MGLHQNGFRDAIGGLRFYGAGVSNGAYPSSLVANFARTAARRNITSGNGITDDTVGIPYGYRAPGAWMLPQKAGALSSHNVIAGAGAVADLNLAGGLNAEAALSGAGDMSGTGALIVSLVAAISGSGTISSATAQAFLNLAATLAGAGDIDGALAALAHAAAELSGDGDAAATATALGTLAAAITVSGDLLTATNVGAAVWSATAASNNDAGTMGNKLNSAASAGDPWGTELPGGYPAGSAGYIVGTYLDAAVSAGGLTVDEAAQLFDVWQRLGLDSANPLVTTSTTIEAGGVSQTIDEAAGPIITVTRT